MYKWKFWWNWELWCKWHMETMKMHSLIHGMLKPYVFGIILILWYKFDNFTVFGAHVSILIYTNIKNMAHWKQNTFYEKKNNLNFKCFFFKGLLSAKMKLGLLIRHHYMLLQMVCKTNVYSFFHPCHNFVMSHIYLGEYRSPVWDNCTMVACSFSPFKNEIVSYP